ncbi:VWA domain-containing protein [Novipirellula maiorica]|nr:VWA domain-containing protein [Rhodopirellula maiorica]
MSESIWNDPRITAYVLDELPTDERATFESEMKSNPELAAAVEEARGVTGKLDALFAAESTPPLDANRRDKIIASENHPTFVTPKFQRAWYQFGGVELVVTAAIVLIICAIAIPASMSPKVAMNGNEVVDPQEEPTLSQEDYMRMAKSGQEEDEEAAELPRSSVDAKQELNSADLADASGAAIAETAPSMTSSMSAAPMAADSISGKPLNRAKAMLNEDAVPPPVAAQPMLKEMAADEGLGGAGQASALSMSPSQTESPGASSGLRAASEPRSEALQKSRRSMMTRRSAAAKEAKDSESAKKSEASQLHSIAPDAPAAPDPFGDASAAHPFEEAEVAQSEYAPGGMDMGMGMSAGPALEALGGASAEPTEAITSGGYALPMDTMTRSRTDLKSHLKQTIPRLPKAVRLLDEEVRNPEGVGPGTPGDQFDVIEDNPFRRVSEHPLSTFSVDVDTASYSKVRDFLTRANQLPRPDAVRIEEMINYFDYNYEPPAGDAEHPFAARAVVTECPWNPQHRLARIALKGKVIEQSERPRCNLVFLLDTSGSMNQANKLPLVQDGMKMLLEQLNENDRVAIAVYAGSAGLVLDSTKVKNGKKVRKALTQLSAGGSTNGGAGIALAYQVARDHFITDGVNRVILCTDGDFNVGTTGTDALVRMVEKEAKGGVFLSVLGFGMGNHNDSMLEQISGRGNGNYAFIDNEKEARKVLVDQTNSTLVTIAKDVKLQVEFNPTQVNSYRLIGYENRVLAKEDFNDDQKDAGEIGAGHSVTALYEIVPAGSEPDAAKPKVDDLKYQAKVKPTEAAQSDEMLTIKLRYKQPDGDTSTLVEFPVTDDEKGFKKADMETRFAAAVAGFGMQLRRSEYKGNWTLSDVIRVAEASKGEDRFELRAEFIQMAQKASQLMGQE